MHHKRRRPKHQRAGCLMCKPAKDNRGKGSAGARTPAEVRADEREASFIAEVGAPEAPEDDRIVPEESPNEPKPLVVTLAAFIRRAV